MKLALYDYIAPILLGSSAAMVSAAPCGILPEGEIRVQLDQREISLDSATRLDPCQGKLSLLEGKAVLTFVRRSNLTEYRTLKLKEAVDLEAIGAQGSRSVPLERIVAFFKSGRRIEAVTAMSRAGERITGFPYDDVLLPRTGMELRMLELQSKGVRVRDFVVHPRGKPDQAFLRVERETDSITIPASLLTEGREYTWAATLTNQEQYVGKFRTLTQGEARRIEQQLEALEGDGTLGEISRRTLRALLLDQNRLGWNRDIALATLSVEPEMEE